MNGNYYVRLAERNDRHSYDRLKAATELEKRMGHERYEKWLDMTLPSAKVARMTNEQVAAVYREALEQLTKGE